MSLPLFSFNFPSLTATEDEDTPYEFTITPNAALTAGYRVRWEIILDGQLPAGFNDFDALSGVVTFASGATGGETITLPIIDDAARGDLKSFSVRLTQIDAGDQEMQIGTDQAISLTDNDIGEFAHISLSSTGEHDTLVAGSSYTYRSFTGVGGNDTMVITRFQTGDITINDVNGQNIIKLDHGVQITDVDRDIFVIPNGGMTIVNSVTITLATGSEITITSPDSGLVGSKRYSFQLGDGALTDYAGFYAAITNGGFKEGDSGPLGKTFVVAYPVAGASTASTDTSTEILFTATLVDAATEDEDTPYEFTITPNAALTAGYRVRWEIILDGQLPAGFNDFDALSGVVTFASGATGGETVTLPIIDDAARGDVKSFSVRLTQIDAGDEELQIGTDQAISLTDNDIGEFAHISLSSTGEHDTLVAGSSYTYRSFTGVGGNDTMVITRFQTGDITINDVNGQNIIKLDHGVQITDVDRDIFVIPNGGMTIVNSITITLATGSEITITSPDSGLVGSKRYSYQIGDGVLTDYAGFYAAITNGGFKEGDSGPLGKTFVVAYPNDVEQVDVTFINLEDSTGTLTETGSASATLLTTASITGENPTDYIEFSTSDSRFTFDGTSLSIASGAAFNFEANDEVVVTVIATKDEGVLPISIEFTLTLTNINDSPPVFTDSPTNVVEGVEIAANGLVYRTIAAGDAGAAVTYSLASGRGDDAHLFNINANTGVVTIVSATTPDYETDQDGYSFTVIATATGGYVAEHAVTIGITPVDEHAPTISGSFTGDAIVAVEATWTPSGTISLFDDADAFADHRTTMITQTESMVGTYGTLSFVGNTWTYTLDAAGAAARGLNNDEAATETFGITAGEHITRNIVITVTGADDPSVVAITTSAGTATENVDGANIDSIRFTVSDIDSDDQNYAASGFAIRSSDTAAISHTAVQGLFEAYLVSGAGDNAVFGVKVQAGQSLDFEAASSYGLRFTYGGSAESDVVTITVTDVNEAPRFLGETFNAAVVDGVNVATTTVLVEAEASAAGQITYSLEGTDSDLFNINGNGGVTFKVATTPDSDAGDNTNGYSFTVVASAGGEVIRQAVTIAVTPVDEHAPERTGEITGSVVAGAAENTVTERLRFANDADSLAAHQTDSIDQTDDMVGIYGTLSFSGDDWTYTLDNADTDTIALGSGEEGTDVFAITAGAHFSENITITVAGANEAPTVVIDDNANIGTIAENINGGVFDTIRFRVMDADTSDQNYMASNFTIISHDATRFQSDEDSQAFFEVYLVEGTGSSSIFGIKLRDGVTLDFETTPTTPGDDEYAIRVVYNDGDTTVTSDPIGLNVTDVDETPTISSNGDITIAEETSPRGTNSPIYTAIASAPAGSPAIVYTLSGTDSELFDIAPDANGNGAVTFKTPTTIDFETNPDGYSFTITASTGGGTATQDVTISLTDVEEGPTITSSATASSIPEATEYGVGFVVYTATANPLIPGQMITYSLVEGDDAALFNIDANSGVVTFKLATTPDVEFGDYRDGYNFTVAATAGGETATLGVFVAVTAVDDFAAVIFGDITGAVTAGLAATVSGTVFLLGDSDSGVEHQTTVVTLVSAPVGTYGSIAFTGNRWVYTLNNNDLDTIALNTGDMGTDVFTVTSSHDVTEDITITVHGIDEITGVEIELAENTAIATDMIIHTATALGDGTADTHVISGGADADLFTIDAATGDVRFAAATTPDFETKARYDFMVTTTAAGQESSIVDVTISITNVDEAPIFTSSTTAEGVIVDGTSTSAGTVVYTATASPGHIGQVVTYALGGSYDHFFFSIDSETGVITTLFSNTFSDEAYPNGFNFTVIATAGGEETIHAINIPIIPPPSVTGDLTGAAIAGGSGATGTLVVAGNAVVTPPTNGVGTYGSIAFTGNAWVYTLDNADTDTIAIGAGGTATEVFTVSVNTGSGVENYDIAITIAGVSATADITLPIGRDAETYDFTTTDFTNINSGDIMGITILSIPTTGLLRLDGNPFFGEQVIAAADISNLGYINPIATARPLRGFDVTFQFSLTLEGGESSDAHTLTLDVAALVSPISVASGAGFTDILRVADSSTDNQNHDLSGVTDGQSRLVITSFGNDIVIGTDLADAFNLQIGNDMVTGGGGNDAFIQRVGLSGTTTNSLTVTDFQFGRDKLVLIDNSVDLLGETFYDLTIGTNVEAELIFRENRVRGLKLDIGDNDVITLNFASDSWIHVSQIKEHLGLADDVTLTDYFVDDAERSGTQYVFTQTAFTEEIFDELLGDGGIEVLQSISDTAFTIF